MDDESKKRKLKILKIINKILVIIQIIIIFFAIALAIFFIYENNCNNKKNIVLVNNENNEIEVFNSKFTAYVGTKRSKSHVIALLSLTLGNNATNVSHQVKINSNNNITSAISKKDTLPEDNYTIKIDSYNEEGYITDIKIINSLGIPIFEED